MSKMSFPVFPRKKINSIFKKKEYVHCISSNSKLNHTLPAMRQMTFFCFFVQKIGQPLQNKLYIFFISTLQKKSNLIDVGKGGSLLGKT